MLDSHQVVEVYSGKVASFGSMKLDIAAQNDSRTCLPGLRELAKQSGFPGA